MSVLEGWAQADVEALTQRGLERVLEPRTGAQGVVVKVGDQSLINFCSNDYLGLAGDARLLTAAHAAIEQNGVGAGASRLVSGDTTAHQALEAALAKFERTATATLFNSGYAANTALLPALLQFGDVVFSDELNHASLVDGCRLSRARIVVYPHGDVEALAALVTQFPGRRRAVVTDTVFSMDGDVAPLRALRSLCDEAGLALIVDEAHATGVLGPTGAGACEAAGVTPDALMGTLSKALGSFGAYVAGSLALKRVLLSTARPLLFSTALPPAVCAAAGAALKVVHTEPERRARLLLNARTLLNSLALPPRGEATPIISIVLGSPAAALQAADELKARGLWVKAIRPPTVPDGTSRLRIALSALHTDEQLARLADGLNDVLSRRSAA